jgi:hypothetical protein
MKGFVGKRKIIYHKTLSYIRFTVGQYWLIIKKNGTKSVNFVRIEIVLFSEFWKICNISRQILVCPEKFFCRQILHSHPPLFKPPRYGPDYNAFQK